MSQRYITSESFSPGGGSRAARTRRGGLEAIGAFVVRAARLEELDLMGDVAEGDAAAGATIGDEDALAGPGAETAHNGARAACTREKGDSGRVGGSDERDGGEEDFELHGG